MVVRSELNMYKPKAIGSFHIQITSQSNEKSMFYNTPNDAL